MKMCQRGVTLIELILVLALMSFATLLAFHEKQADLEQARARQVGAMLFQYNNAVRAAMNQGVITATTLKIGADWLRNVTCGGQRPVDKEFLPCEFPSASVVSPISFGKLTLSTNIVVTGTAPDRKYKATTTTTPFILTKTGGLPEIRADLAGVATLAAAAATATGFGVNAGGGLSPINATTDASFSSNPKTGVISIVSSNSANDDVWLRTDGGNKMHASLGFDGAAPADRQIMGASRIQNLAGQVLRIGSGSALTPITSSGVVIDTSTEILGDFKVRQSLVVDSSASVAGNITSGGAIYASGGISSGTSVTAQVFYDANDTAYYLDPNNTSRVNTLAAQGSITSGGNITSGGYIQANGNLLAQANVTAQGNISANGAITSNGSMTAAGNITANNALVGQIFYDSNNMGYYVDPHATSNLNAVNAVNVISNGRMKTTEYLELGGIAVVGNGCAPNGLLGRTPEGKALSCESGAWKSLGGTLDGPYRVSGTNLGSWAMCTLNYGSGNSKSLTYNGVEWIYSGSGTQVVYCYR